MNLRTPEDVERHWSEIRGTSWFRDYLYKFRFAADLASYRIKVNWTKLETADEVGAWMQAFWEELPDAPEIHVEPAFSTVCAFALWRTG